MAKIGQDISYAVQLLKASQLVAIPTETVYGLAGNGLDEKAVASIFQAKNRPSFDPMILHTNSLDKIRPLVKEIPEALQLLADTFMPGPLSLLLEKTEQIPDIVTAGSAKVAIRIPRHPLTLELLTALDFPVAAPSANPFGYISPTSAQHVQDQLGEIIPYILDGGPCQVGLESTIVEMTGQGVKVLRVGGIPVEDIERVVGPVEVQKHSSSNPQAPGMLASHYAPKVRLVLRGIDEVLQQHDPERVGVLAFQKKHPAIPSANQLVLSEKGDLVEAAQHLFSHLRQLDQMDLDIIVAERVPDEGLGRAINDKLRRASAS
jgi:L-threonylcarbamoyladenylate synthase